MIFALRLLLYPVGFFVTVLLSLSMTPMDFGIYSAMMSLLELTLIISICGASFSLATWTANTKCRPNAKEIRRITAMGLPIACAVAIAAAFISHRFTIDAITLLILNLGVQSLSLLHLSALRGLGNAGSQVIEPLVRYTVSLPIVATAYAIGQRLSPESTLLVTLVANLAALIYAVSVFKQYPRIDGSATTNLSLVSPWTAAFSVMQFGLRKSDVLLVMWLTGPLTAGSMKLAFPILEIPTQLYLLSIVRRTAGIVDRGTKQGFKGAFSGELNAAIPYALLVIAALPAVRLAQEFNLWSEQVMSSAIAIAPLMVVRLLTTSFEQTVTLLGRYKIANSVALIEAAVKSVAIVGACVNNLDIQSTYVWLAICEGGTYILAALWSSRNIFKSTAC